MTEQRQDISSSSSSSLSSNSRSYQPSDSSTTTASFINTYAGALNTRFLLETGGLVPSEDGHLEKDLQNCKLDSSKNENNLVYSNDSPTASTPFSSKFRLMTTSPPLAAELAAVEQKSQSVLARANRGHRHSTWAKTFHSQPELYFQPQSVADVQEIVLLAQRHGRRLVTVGSRHSPSDLTCTSNWMLNLCGLNKILHIEKDNVSDSPSESRTSLLGGKSSRASRRVVFQTGISLRDLNIEMASHGLTLPNLGSIDEQSFAGAIATGTHGSSLRHGLLSENVRGLRIVLANGQACWCSSDEHPDLFQAALVSLGGLGVITEVEYEMVPAADIEWEQSMVSREYVVDSWHKGFWTQAEFVRCWWMPYTNRMIFWKAEKTDKPRRKPEVGWYGGALGYYVYLNLLWLGHHFTRLIPTVEWFVIGMQFGFKPGRVQTAVEEQRTGLLLDCLFSQNVNEWAIPLSKGPEAINRIASWLAGDDEAARIPFPSKGVYVHCPIEVRVSNGSRTPSLPRAFLDPTCDDGPTLYLNAIMYRPYGLEAPGKERYYQAFEWLMQDLGGRPHWAKNFATMDHTDMKSFYGDKLIQWLEQKSLVDPDGMFTGAWHRRNLLGDSVDDTALEEKNLNEKKVWWTGGVQVTGALADKGRDE